MALYRGSVCLPFPTSQKSPARSATTDVRDTVSRVVNRHRFPRRTSFLLVFGPKPLERMMPFADLIRQSPVADAEVPGRAPRSPEHRRRQSAKADFV
jgi:hypothetical protein